MLDTDEIQQCVFIVGDGSVFDSAVTRLVTYGTNLRVLHALYSPTLTFLDLINWDGSPETILINESGSLNADNILGLVSTRLVSSQSIIPGTRIIIVRLSVNAIDVYTHPIFVRGEVTGGPRRINILTSDDLLNAVTSKHPDQ
ncbi:MAG TPA: hypothetical protein VJ987_06865 [Anaerolineales bacterium]|nr:hypothetical protein [Anaerolineales bacterium]